MRGWALLAVALAAFAGTAEAVPFEILDSNETRLKIAFSLPGYDLTELNVEGETYARVKAPAVLTTTEIGRPDLPVFSTLVGIRPGARVALEIVDIETRVIEGVMPLPVAEQRIVKPEEGDLPTPIEIFTKDDETYGTDALYPPAVADVGAEARLRNQSIVPLRITPIRFRGGPSPSLVVATRVVVELTFDRSLTREADYIAAPSDSDFESIYRRSVINHEQATAWRGRRPVTVPASARLRGLRPSNPEVKIRIKDTELVRIEHRRLREAGWVETPPVEAVQLTSRGYDADSLDVGADPFLVDSIGVTVMDVDDDGLFDGSDYLLIYGMHAKEQRGWEPPEDRYTWDNIYWLTWEEGAGSVMPARSGEPLGGDVAEPDGYEYWERHEDNGDDGYLATASDYDDRFMRRQSTDHLFFDNGINIGSEGELGKRFEFDVNDPVENSPFGFRAEWWGIEPGTKTFSPSINIGTGDSFGELFPGTPFIVVNRGFYYYNTGGLAEGMSHYIDSGPHQLVYLIHDQYDRVALNWFEIGYLRTYRAAEGQLRFSNGGIQGRVQYSVTGFESEDLIVLDITNPDQPVRITDAQIVEDGSTFSLVFEDDVDELERWYIAQEIDAIDGLYATRFTLETKPDYLLSDLSPSNPNLAADYLMVVYDDFAEELEPLVTHREAQGHRVEVARISDVYDEFSGGLVSADAIRHYVRHCYRLRPSSGGVQPLYLLLVGDGSEDYQRVGSSSMPNFVPTYQVLGDAYDSGGQPLISADHMFISNPDGDDENGNPFISSIMVGRLPVGSEEQATDVVQKIIRYEDNFFADPQSQDWRRRGLLVADDSYSGVGVGTGQGAYQCRSSEFVFVETSRAAADTIMAAGYADFDTVTFFLSDYLNHIPELDRDPLDCDNNGPALGWRGTREYVRCEMDLDATFRQEVNRGHLFVTYQGHGNNALMSHEYLMVGNTYTCEGGLSEDVELLGNEGRPAIWFFFACHIAEFDWWIEEKPTVGDCLGERLLFHRNAGSIASIGSTGFEWLNMNDDMHLAIFHSWFYDPLASIGLTGEPGLHLGEVMLSAKNLLVASGGGDPDARSGMVESYALLGDPGLRIDIAPPRFNVWQDQGDAPWEEAEPPDPLTSGTALMGRDAAADTARFAARIYDEVPIHPDSIMIGERTDEGTTWITPDDLVMIPMWPGLPEIPDSLEAIPDSLRSLISRYHLNASVPLTPRDYDLIFHASDHYGRSIDLVLESRVSMEFYEVPENGGEPRQILDGAFFDPSSDIRVQLESPVGIPEDDLDFYINGEPLTVGVSRTAGDDVIETRCHVWTIDVDVQSSRLEANNIFAIGWMEGGDLDEMGSSVTVSTSGVFELGRHFAFPNPFSSDAGIFYRVTRAARSATVKIFTLSGRQIQTLVQERPTADINRILWNGRDADGETVASGVYFYRLEIVGPNGERMTKQGKIARVVGHDRP